MQEKEIKTLFENNVKKKKKQKKKLLFANRAMFATEVSGQKVGQHCF